MPQDENPKRFDLEDRTFAFAHRCRVFVKKLPKTIANLEDARQLIRASGSVGANYIEANEALSKKDFIQAHKDLPQRGEGEPLLVAPAGGRRGPKLRAGCAGSGRPGTDEYLRRHSP